MKNIFYFRYLAICGGIETFFYYLGKKYRERDITVYYSCAEPETVERISKYIRVKKHRGETITCERAFFCYNLDIINSVQAEEYIQIVHGDYAALGIVPQLHPKITKYVGVSGTVAESFSRANGVLCETAYNPIAPDEPRKLLRLVSATRLSSEKGKRRMLRLAELLDQAEISFDWTVFTPDTAPLPHRNIVFRPPREDIWDHIAASDYLVQLSDSEGYCYSVVEALTLGTPVIVTRLPVFDELGIEHGKHGFLVGAELDDVPLDAIRKGIRRVKWTAPADRWGELLAEGRSTYSNKGVRIRITADYFDLRMKRSVEAGTVLTVSQWRAEQIIDAGLAEYV